MTQVPRMNRSLKKGQTMEKTSRPQKGPKSPKRIESSKEEITSKLLELLIVSSEEEEEGLSLLEVKFF